MKSDLLGLPPDVKPALNMELMTLPTSTALVEQFAYYPSSEGTNPVSLLAKWVGGHMIVGGRQALPRWETRYALISDFLLRSFCQIKYVVQKIP